MARRSEYAVDEAVDPGQAVVGGLREVDFLAYSAIFSDPSGNVGRPDQSSEAYLERARVATVATLRQYKTLMGLLPGF